MTIISLELHEAFVQRWLFSVNVELSKYPDHVVPGTWFRPWFHALVTVAPVEIRSPVVLCRSMKVRTLHLTTSCAELIIYENCPYQIHQSVNYGIKSVRSHHVLVSCNPHFLL